MALTPLVVPGFSLRSLLFALSPRDAIALQSFISIFVMHLVVGSGPAGVACAYALLNAGHTVMMIDAGLKIEPERQSVVDSMRPRDAETWTASEIAMLSEGAEVDARGIGLKHVFGSDFPYRGAAEHVGKMDKDTGLRPSLALGGLSNVWGAAMMPYHSEDIANWPITAADLAPHYTAVARITGMAGQRDRLAESFPLFCDPITPLQMSRQAKDFYQQLEKNASLLSQAGLEFGTSRLAVRGSQTAEGRGCAYCRMCMYGCPYGCIYNSADTVAAFRANPLFSYKPGVIVTRVEEHGDTVRLSGYERETGAPWTCDGDRAYLAAGVLPTSRILLNSCDGGDECTVLDSQYFLFPLLSLRATPGVREEAAFTLSQMFLELSDPTISPHRVHFQVYSHSAMIGEAVRKSLGPLGFYWFVRALCERLLIVQGYLHSDQSARLRVRLDRSDPRARIQLSVERNPATARVVKRVLRKLLRLAPSLGAAALRPMLQMTAPGRGFHSGGSWPMRAQPGRGETDTLGRPAGWSRVHAVDATIFPTVPATTITFSAMANAHRIGTAAAGM